MNLQDFLTFLLICSNAKIDFQGFNFGIINGKFEPSYNIYIKNDESEKPKPLQPLLESGFDFKTYTNKEATEENKQFKFIHVLTRSKNG